MKNRVYIAFSATEYAPATSIWRALTAPGLTRWMSTRDVMDDNKTEAQDLEELARAAMLVLVLSEYTVAGDRLTQELQQAQSRRLPLLVVLRGETTQCPDRWAEVLASATNVRVAKTLTRGDLANVVDSIRTILGLPPVPDAPTEAAPAEDAKAYPAAATDTPVSFRASKSKPILPKRPETPLEASARSHQQAGTPGAKVQTKNQAEEGEESTPAAARGSVNSAGNGKKFWSKLWPPTLRTLLIGASAMAGLVLVTAVVCLMLSGTTPAVDQAAPQIGSLAAARPTAPSPPPVNAPALASPQPGADNKPIPIGDDGSTTTSSRPQAASGVEHILRPSSILTPDQSPTHAGDAASPTPAAPTGPQTGDKPSPAEGGNYPAATQPAPSSSGNNGNSSANDARG